MRRIQFFEIHEQPWFPSSLRDFVTDALQSGLELVKAYAPIEARWTPRKAATWLIYAPGAGDRGWTCHSDSTVVPKACKSGYRTNIRTCGHSEKRAPYTENSSHMARTRLTR
jgi:hypothetical protein